MIYFLILAAIVCKYFLKLNKNFTEVVNLSIIVMSLLSLSELTAILDIIYKDLFPSILKRLAFCACLIYSTKYFRSEFYVNLIWMTVSIILFSFCIDLTLVTFMFTSTAIVDLNNLIRTIL